MVLQFYIVIRDRTLVSTPSCTSDSSERDRSSIVEHLSICKWSETEHGNPHRAIVTSDVLGFVELSEDSLGQNLAKFDAHLI